MAMPTMVTPEEAGTMETGVMEAGMEMPQPLIVYVQVVKENATSPRHDISVRRVQGTAWSFQAFYSAFRDEVARQLGMSDYAQLSLYSPIVQKRLPAQQRVSSAWMTRGQAPAVPLGIPLTKSVSSSAMVGELQMIRGAAGKRLLDPAAAADSARAAAAGCTPFDPASGMTSSTARMASPQQPRAFCAPQPEGGTGSAAPEEPRFKLR